MEFNLCISIKVDMDPWTGIPCVPGTRFPMNLEDYKVPEEHRWILAVEGWQLEPYIPNVSFYNKKADSCTIEAFLMFFPTWEEYMKRTKGGYSAIWKEADHARMKASLEWFMSKPGYMIEWY